MHCRVRVGRARRSQGKTPLERDLRGVRYGYVTNAVIQAEQLGTSLAQLLRVQAQRLRVRHRQRAEQEARRTPVKMVFPLVFCLMPSLFLHPGPHCRELRDLPLEPMNPGGQIPNHALGADPFRTLYLVPTAPHELVVQVYWHLIHRVRAEAKENPSAGSRLDRLNEAYAALVGPSREPTTKPHVELGREEAAERVKTGRHLEAWLRRRPKRQPVESEAKVSPWAVLRVSPEAPTEIVDLAYAFWRARLRGQWCESPKSAAARLEEAYRAVRESSPESSVASELAPARSTEAAADLSETLEDDGRSGLANLMSGQGDRSRLWLWIAAVSRAVGLWARIGAKGTLRFVQTLALRLWRLGCQTAVWTARRGLSIARAAWKSLRAHAPRAWRLARGTATYAVRRAFRAGLAGRERLIAAFEGRAGAPDPAVEERFKALVATRKDNFHREATDGASHDDESPGGLTRP